MNMARKGEPPYSSSLDIKAWLAAIISNSHNAILSKTLQGRISSSNIGAERLFGYTSEEAIGQHISLIVPEDHLFEEEQTTIRALLKVVLDLYRTTSGGIKIVGQDAPVGPSALGSIALVIHEDLL